MSKQREYTVDESWGRIESWLNQNAPDFSLPEGASDKEIREAETATAVTFPDDMRKSYALHDGSNRLWIVEQGYLMPLTKPKSLPKSKQALFSGVVDSWQSMKEMVEEGYFSDKSHPKGPIRTCWWSVKWIPITYNQAGDHLCVDLDPPSRGTSGQIIDWWHEQGATSIIAGRFAAWLSTVAKKLESGNCYYDEKANAIKQEGSK